MLEWMLVVAAVGSNAVVAPDAGHFPTNEACQGEAREIVAGRPGELYGFCRPYERTTGDVPTAVGARRPRSSRR